MADDDDWGSGGGGGAEDAGADAGGDDGWGESRAAAPAPHNLVVSELIVVCYEMCNGRRRR